MRFVANGRIFAFAALAALIVLVAPGAAQTPEGAPPERQTPLQRLEPFKLELDQLQAAARRDGLNADELTDLRSHVIEVRDAVRARVDDLEPRLANVDTRLKQLGPAPAAGAAENPAIAAERAQLNRFHGELDAAIKQAKLLALRADNLANRLVERRRALFTRELLARNSSVLDWTFWRDVAGEVPGEASGVGVLARSWWSYALDNGGPGGMAGAAVTLLLMIAAGIWLRRWWRRTLALPQIDTRFGKASCALLKFVRIVATAPVATAALVLVLDAFGLMPERIKDIGSGLILAVFIAAFGRGAAVALLAPGEPARRLVPLGDEAAARIADHFIWAVRGVGAVIVLNIIHRAVVSPISLTVASTALLALLVAALLVHALYRLRRSGSESDPRGQWLRSLAWLVAIAILLALATGYIGLAAFIAGRLLSVLAVGGVLYVLLVFTDALFSEVLTGDSPRGRALAAMLGLKARGIELLGTLLSAVIRVTLVLVAVFPAVGPGTIFAADIFDTLHDAVFGFRIGGITISISAILGSLAVLFVGVLLTRGVQRWLETRFLPRTGLEQSLQHSISLIFGYVAVIAILVLALAQIGLDLEKIALIAGALSVGIGFGLQSIVSNFICGIILLAERPIRVGDTIVVKGEEGWVRRIRVRATEIETFERASVIIPNSELITGVVKNWTHVNTYGRIVIKVGVAFDSDPDQVRDILVECASEHPQVLANPPSRAMIVAFGDSALQFELTCVVANVDYGPIVKSDIHFAILRRFRAADIDMPFPQRELRWTQDGSPPPAAGPSRAPA